MVGRETSVVARGEAKGEWLIPEQKEHFDTGEALNEANPVTDKEFRERILESSRQMLRSREELLGFASPVGVPEGTIFNRLDTGDPIILHDGQWVPMTKAPASPPGFVPETVAGGKPNHLSPPAQK
jgi:hypothetical protein